jgi:hypothetical protein
MRLAGCLSSPLFYLWLYASTIRVPTNIQSGFGALVGVDEMTAGFRKQALLNSYAAVATATAAFFQAAAAITPP